MADQPAAERDREFWTARARNVAALAGADAVGVVLPLPDGRYVAYAGHNLPAEAAWLDGAPQYLVWSAVRQRALQRRAETAVTLADGTVARSMVVAPIPWSDRVIGALILLRASATYDEAAGAAPEELARLMGLELAVSSVLQRTDQKRPEDDSVRRAIEDRRHAIALYELGRLALRLGDRSSAAALLADSLGYAVVGVWGLDGGTLRLEDAHGYGTTPPGPVAVDSDPALPRVVRDGVAQRVQRGPNGARPWMGPAGEVIAAPLGEGSRGVLVVGDPPQGFGPADVALAPSLGEAVGLVRRARAVPAIREAQRPAPEPAPTIARPEMPRAVAVAAPSEAPAPSRTRRGWVVPLFLLALVASGIGAFLTEPLVFVLAGLLLLVALWGWLA
ncbi:MAG TPA: hypothetical protein VFM93_07785 [Candidatus Limnocylindria bacterium]|nr:hypothetical protein [Candidatus Limnocylindria bacterium]